MANVTAYPARAMRDLCIDLVIWFRESRKRVPQLQKLRISQITLDHGNLLCQGTDSLHTIKALFEKVVTIPHIKVIEHKDSGTLVAVRQVVILYDVGEYTSGLTMYVRMRMNACPLHDTHHRGNPIPTYRR